MGETGKKLWPLWLFLSLLGAGIITSVAVLFTQQASSSGALANVEENNLVRNENQAFYTQADIASTEAINLNEFKPGNSMDGMNVEISYRILLKNQPDSTNGLWVFDSNENLVRAPEMDNDTILVPGTLVFVSSGLINANKLFYLNFRQTSSNRTEDTVQARSFENLSVFPLAPQETSLAEQSIHGTNQVRLRAPDALNQDLTFTLPDSYGEIYNFLTAQNSEGKLGWQQGALVHVSAGVPGTSDYEFPLGSLWVNTDTEAMYYLANNEANSALWFQIRAAPVGSGTGTSGFMYTLTVPIDDKTGVSNPVFTRVGSIMFPGDQLAASGGTVTLVRANCYLEGSTVPSNGELRLYDIGARKTITSILTSSTSPSHIVATSDVNNIDSTRKLLDCDLRLLVGDGRVRVNHLVFDIEVE